MVSYTRARVFLYFSAQVDSINSLLKRPVMAKAYEETKHFYADHGHLGKPVYLHECVCVCVLKGISLIITAHTRCF